MEAGRKRNISRGERYSHLFPAATNSTSTILKDANVYHTVEFIPKVVNETLNQTAGIAKELRGKNLYETCGNIWRFVYGHIAYKKDADGYEQIRSPARAWHDRFSGVDCDCYSVFISSILTNLKIKHVLRITKYHRDYFQHIYPIVPTEKGYITIDCVTDKFDFEVPFSEKKDYPMDLQYLNGFDNSGSYDSSGMSDLGKVIQQRFAAGNKRAAPAKRSAPAKHAAAARGNHPVKSGAKGPAAKKAKAPKAGGNAVKKTKGLKKVLNKVNKLNPATIALRNGILASMKLNTMNVGRRLRWSYLTAADAVKKGIDPNKFQKIIHARQKLESIFYKAGGKPENLRKAIIKGKGNKDKAVQGLDGVQGFDGLIEYMNEYTPMGQLLGQEIYFSENVEGMEGLGELGEPLTLASIAAASGVIAGIAGMLKQVGDIFLKKNKNSEDFAEATNEQAEKEAAALPIDPAEVPALPEVSTSEVKATPSGETYPPPAQTTDNPSVPATSVVKNSSGSSESDSGGPVTIAENAETKIIKTAEDQDEAQEKSLTKTDSGKVADPEPTEGFWDKNKKWLKPVAIGVGGITVLVIGMKMLKSKDSKSKAPAKALNGFPKKKYKKSHHKRVSKTHGHKKAIALL